MNMIEPCHDIAHLGQVELLTPALEQSLAFFIDVMGMSASGRDARSVYVRAFDHYEFHTLKLTAAERPGMGYVAFRTSSPQALARRVQALEADGCGRGWHEGDLGHGRAFRAASSGRTSV
jgi:catechol 2,3-dioxygenase